MSILYTVKAVTSEIVSKFEIYKISTTFPDIRFADLRPFV